MNRLRELRERRKLPQKDIAALIGKTIQAYSLYELGKRNIDNDALMQLSKFYNVSVDYLLGNEAPSYLMGFNTVTNNKIGIKIPVLGRVIAGIPIEAVTEILDYEEIPEEMARTGEYFALKIKGNSMAPRIRDGDVVIVRKQETVENGEVAIVLVNGNEATIKEIQRSNFGLTLIGWNPAEYQPHFYSIDEVENFPVQIIGKVVELRGKF